MDSCWLVGDDGVCFWLLDTETALSVIDKNTPLCIPRTAAYKTDVESYHIWCGGCGATRTRNKVHSYIVNVNTQYLSTWKSCKQSYDGCAMRVVFSRLQNCPGFSGGDFRDGRRAFQHVGPDTAKAREPYVTVLVRWKSISPWVAANEWVGRFLTAHQHIIGYFSALQWCEYCDKNVKILSRLFSYDKNRVTRRRVEK